MNLQGKNVLVVGGFGGLGRHLVEQLAANGATVYATTRANNNPNALALDLSDANSIERAAESLSTIKLSGLVLAAGEVAFGPASSTPSVIFERLMQVNATGQIQLINALVSNLSSTAAETQQDSFIVSLSGKVAEIPTTGLAAYSASKAALFAYSAAAGRELRKSGIRWIDARPGHTETGLASRAVWGESPNFGAGLEPIQVAQRIIAALVNDEKDLPSSAFGA